MKSKKLLKTTMTITPNNTQLQDSFGKLNAEILGLIQQRHAEYDACMQITAREYFAECIDEFLANFCQAMEDCSMQLKSIASRVKRKLKITLLNFYDYIARGLWLLRESPRCREQMEHLYFIPETFDVASLRSLIADVKDSVSYENLVDDGNMRLVLMRLRENLISDLQSISNIIDGDMKGRGFAIMRWAAKFRSDIREVRGIYEQQWDANINPTEYDSLPQVLSQVKDSTLDDFESSPFYIKDFSDTNKLVQSIHSMQDEADAQELDKFLYNYALLEYLEERINLIDTNRQKRNTVEINFYAPMTNNGTLSGNIINN